MTTLAADQFLVAPSQAEALKFMRSTAEVRHAGDMLDVLLFGPPIPVAFYSEVVDHHVARIPHESP